MKRFMSVPPRLGVQAVDPSTAVQHTTECSQGKIFVASIGREPMQNNPPDQFRELRELSEENVKDLLAVLSPADTTTRIPLDSCR
jgi:hypothetical protein